MQSPAPRHVPAPETSRSSRANLWQRIPRWLRILAVILVAVAVLVPLAGLAAGEPMRRSLEARMNRQLKGYSVSIGKLRFQPIGGSLTLRDLKVRQLAHPQPALADIPRLKASVQWKELLFLRVVADFLIERPRVHVNLVQLRSELADDVPVKERGWQQAIQEIYPLKINLLRIEEADITYIDDDPKRPLRLTHLNARASNIRNLHSQKQTYPSPIEVDAVVFETGRGSIRGDADFLSEPHPGVRGQFRLAGIPLDRLGPVAQHWNVETSGGVLSTNGEIEYAPGIRKDPPSGARDSRRARRLRPPDGGAGKDGDGSCRETRPHRSGDAALGPPARSLPTDGLRSRLRRQGAHARLSGLRQPGFGRGRRLLEDEKRRHGKGRVSRAVHGHRARHRDRQRPRRGQGPGLRPATSRSKRRT